MAVVAAGALHASGSVAVDASRNLAVVAGTSAGVHFVDVSDAMQPVLRKTVSLPLGASRNRPPADGENGIIGNSGRIGRLGNTSPTKLSGRRACGDGRWPVISGKE